MRYTVFSNNVYDRTIDDRFEITVTMSTHAFFAYLLNSAVTGVSRMLMSIKNSKERYLLLSNHVVCESERTPPCFFPTNIKYCNGNGRVRILNSLVLGARAAMTLK